VYLLNKGTSFWNFVLTVDVTKCCQQSTDDRHLLIALSDQLYVQRNDRLFELRWFDFCRDLLYKLLYNKSIKKVHNMSTFHRERGCTHRHDELKTDVFFRSSLQMFLLQGLVVFQDSC